MAFMRPTADYFTAEEAFECACNEEGADRETLDPEDFKAGWYGCLHAPGYLDRTNYNGPFDTYEDAIQEVMNTYEVDENGDDPIEDQAGMVIGGVDEYGSVD